MDMNYYPGRNFYPRSTFWDNLWCWALLPFGLVFLTLWSLWDLLFSTWRSVSTNEHLGLVPRLLERRAHASR